MINLNEIRLGNYFKHNGSWNYANHKGFFKWSDSDWHALGESTLDVEDIKPIPLTEEWLFKFGFELDESENTWYFYNNEIVSFGISNVKGKWEFYLSNSPVDYLHQVQNLFFALVGEELTLKD